MEPKKDQETGASDRFLDDGTPAEDRRDKTERHLSPMVPKGKGKRNSAAKSSPATDCRRQVEMSADAMGKLTSTRRAPGPLEEAIPAGGMDHEPSIDDIDFKNVSTAMCALELPSTSSANKKSTKASDDPTSKLSIAKLLMDDDDDEDFFFQSAQEVGGNVEVDAKIEKSEPRIIDDHPIKSVHDDDDDDDEKKCDNSIIAAAKMLATSVNKDDKPEVLVITKEPAQSGQPKTEWAEVVNINKPVTDFHKKVPVMAKTWTFDLDVFQKQAIIHLEQHENVFVAAHTSAGKTVVAEYAIALSMRHMTRTIYTSPIKALSNQKYRDFKETFEDVGLLTGDIQINPSASCLIMTTEILRSMLYNGSDTIRDLEWVIFDEVHYINDAERGVVWEEVLIMLPQQVNIVLLSATVPNTLQFADWIGRTKRKKIYVISTPKRPVPLEHHLYIEAAPKGQEKLFLLINQDGKLNTSGYTAALAARSSSSKAAKRQQYGSKMPRTALGIHQEKNLFVDVVNVLKKRDKLPVVVFTFSRYRCDRNARSLFSLDLTTATEKNRITEFVRRCVDRLTESDRNLPQVRAIQDLLLQGIGVHHSGILPILKEVVELLFQQGHVKLLFATETFAMGVNMPARTVVFDAIKKHDGMQSRNLTAAEYIQMAGRAGRRGLDETGLVIVLCKDDIPELSDLNAMMMGKPALLESQFRLTYSMILNLLSVDGLTVEDMMKRSFSEADNQKRIPALQMQVNEMNRKVASLKGVDCEICSSTLEDYYCACDSYVLECTDIWEIVFKSPTVLASGRIVLIVVAAKSARPRFAAILKETKEASSASDLASKRSVFTVLTTRNVEEEEQDVQPSPPLENNVHIAAEDDWPHYLNAHEYLVSVPDATHHKFVTQCKSDDILLITSRMLRADTSRVLKDWEKRQIPRFKDDQPSESFLSAAQELISFAQQCHDQQCEDIAFDPFKDRALKDVIDLHDKIPHSKNVRQYLRQSPCINCVHFEEHFHHVYRAMKLKEKLRSKQLMLRRSLVLQPEYESRVQVLKELKYVDGGNTVNLKGRVARRIGSNELIITELILNNVFTEMEPAEIAALLSCMVFQEKHCSEANLNAVLKKGVEDIMENVKRIARVQRDNGVRDEHYEKQFNFNLAEVVYEWAKGTSFTDIMQLTDVQEGVIVRCIQRLDEILRDVKEAAKTVGNPVLQNKMDEASQAIKRDIVFAASLYTH